MKTILLLTVLILCLLATSVKGQDIKIGDIAISDSLAKNYFLWCYQHPDTSWYFRYSESKKEVEEQQKKYEAREKIVNAKLAKAKNHADTLKAYSNLTGVDVASSYSRIISERENYLSSHNIGEVGKKEKKDSDMTWYYTGYLTKHEPTAQDFSEWYIKQEAKK
jgi:hypothetical protein